jgi:cysteine synthase
MQAPKILPWIARKAGISDELALKLWRRAASEAEYLTGQSTGSEYWGLAV